MGKNINDLLSTLSSFSSPRIGEIGVFPFLAVLAISLFCSLFLCFLYVRFYKVRATGSLVYRSFPLVGISITAIFICIQFSLPLSLGLLGALSIVRFRTPIKEPEEIGFIMLVVATSLACATFNLVFLALILIVAVLALFVLKLSRGFTDGRLNDGMVIITLPAKDYPQKSDELLDFLERKLPRGRIDSVTENHEESIISYSFSRLTRGTLVELPVELKKITESAKSNVYFNRSAEV
ncbi:DUF4956 domain-containing protein [Acidobacteriota bacterium]